MGTNSKENVGLWSPMSCDTYVDLFMERHAYSTFDFMNLAPTSIKDTRALCICSSCSFNMCVITSQICYHIFVSKTSCTSHLLSNKPFSRLSLEALVDMEYTCRSQLLVEEYTTRPSTLCDCQLLDLLELHLAQAICLGLAFSN
jgi:hypothetical protein